MSTLEELVGKVRRGERLPPTLSMLLHAASVVPRAGMWWRMRQMPVRVDARVISIGNLTAGGTGKTPAVIARAAKETGKGNRVAVLTRGYGSRTENTPRTLSPGETALASELGDEPALIARRVPGVTIVKGADRVAGARHAIEALQCDTLILDDGYQYVGLRRDENVLVIDATNPFGNGYLVPRGILREPVDAADRATEIVLTRCDQAEDALQDLTAFLRVVSGGCRIRHTRHAPKRLWRVRDGEEVPLERLQERPVRAVCSIGHPSAFFATLETLGATLCERHAQLDHTPIPSSLLQGKEITVVTEKDAVRIEDAPEEVYALGVDLEQWPPEKEI